MKFLVSWLTSFVGRITLLFLTFAVGLGSIFFWFEVAQPKVTFCQLARNPEWYDGKTISVEADGRSYNGSFVVSEDDCQVYDSHVSVWLDKSYQSSDETQSFYQKSPAEIRTARVVITGRFDAHARVNCNTPKWAILTTNVLIKSPIATEIIDPPRKTDELPSDSDDHVIGGFTMC